jgi:hypothetical protein
MAVRFCTTVLYSLKLVDFCDFHLNRSADELSKRFVLNMCLKHMGRGCGKGTLHQWELNQINFNKSIREQLSIGSPHKD